MKAHLLLLVPACVSALSSVALAQDAPPPPPSPPSETSPAIQLTPQQPAEPPPGRINLATAPNAAPVQRTYHYHEGFYLRTSLGFGSYASSFTDNKRKQNFDAHDASLSIDLLVGGSPSPGVAIGGALLLDPQLGHNGGGITLLGPFIDGFPNVSRGWHLGGMIGIAGQGFRNDNANEQQKAGGIGGALWAGYDFWVADEWSIGPQLRLMGVRTASAKSGEDLSGSARSITFGLSAVFN